jgi:hypothetical protein
VIATGDGSELFGEIPTVASQLTLSPGMESGLASVGNGICQTVGLLEGGSLRPWDITLGNGDDAFSPGDQLRAGFGEDCPTQGRADWPTWSPDGAQVALFISPTP